jgi:hypothetical protein
VPLTGSRSKWKFACPFCGSLGKTEGKKHHRKAALLWNETQNSWIFTCSKKGSLKCDRNMTFGNFIGALNPWLGEEYKRNRWHSGTVGKGHNCSPPGFISGISTGSLALPGISSFRR